MINQTTNISDAAERVLGELELDAVVGGACELDITEIKCPIGSLRVLTADCPGVKSPQVSYSPK